MMGSWWRLDDWFRPVRPSGTPVATRRGKVYDVQPPLWFRAGGFAGALTGIALARGLGEREWLWVALSIGVAAGYTTACVLWQRRHRVG